MGAHMLWKVHGRFVFMLAKTGPWMQSVPAKAETISASVCTQSQAGPGSRSPALEIHTLKYLPQHTATTNTLLLSSGSLASQTLQILLQIRNSGMKYIQMHTRNIGGIIYRQFVLLQAPKIHKTSCIHSLDMKRLKHGMAWNSANNNTQFLQFKNIPSILSFKNL